MGITYYQVAATVRDENTLRHDDVTTAGHNGTRRVNALKWMMWNNFGKHKKNAASNLVIRESLAAFFYL